MIGDVSCGKAVPDALRGLAVKLRLFSKMSQRYRPSFFTAIAMR
jgi:hypothetical protein